MEMKGRLVLRTGKFLKGKEQEIRSDIRFEVKIHNKLRVDKITELEGSIHFPFNLRL